MKFGIRHLNRQSPRGETRQPRLEGHAIAGLTMAAALELGGDGIRVNSLHPGMIRTAGFWLGS